MDGRKEDAYQREVTKIYPHCHSSGCLGIEQKYALMGDIYRDYVSVSMPCSWHSTGKAGLVSANAAESEAVVGLERFLSAIDA